MSEAKQKPIHEIRLGRVRAAVWKNTGETGTWSSVTFSKLYKGKDGKWQDTGSFGREDLLPLAEVARQVAFLLYNEEPEGEQTEGKE
jgi:hypothetical protein